MREAGLSPQEENVSNISNKTPAEVKWTIKMIEGGRLKKLDDQRRPG